MFPSERRTNNYPGKFCMLHLIDVAGRKIPPIPKRKRWSICHVGCQSCCLAQPNCCHGFSISAFSGSLKVAVGCMCVDTIATIFFTVTVYSEAQNDIQRVKKHTPPVSVLSLQLTSSNFIRISSVDCRSWKCKPI